ncbi:hypothetical protein EBX93_18855, partial [bacterium]|nr:hypothetical protein [bacterium]
SKIYLITNSMNIIFTGAKTTNDKCKNLLIDGEYIQRDKHDKYINLFAAFDLYYIDGKDIRSEPFLTSRYNQLKDIILAISPIGITSNNKHVTISPLRIMVKEFFASTPIFTSCNKVLSNIRNGYYEYNTDGLVFTPTMSGVGGKSSAKSTWNELFKWKPPQYNTIDFLIKTIKSPNGKDIIYDGYSDENDYSVSMVSSKFKTVELRCGFSERKDGFINPCQRIIDDDYSHHTSNVNDYVPVRFYPIEPEDNNAGITNILLKMDKLGTMQMFTEANELIEDNMIVEFRYDHTLQNGWRWIPIKVRYDKTSRFRKGEKEFGNSFKVCNDNWKSLHPASMVTENMLSTGLGIP